MATAKVIAPVSKRPGTKLRVAAYCRVSSNSADQQNSYSRQVDAYTRLVSNNPAWELVDIFADAGISGMKADNRGLIKERYAVPPAEKRPFPAVRTFPAWAVP